MSRQALSRNCIHHSRSSTSRVGIPSCSSVTHLMTICTFFSHYMLTVTFRCYLPNLPIVYVPCIPPSHHCTCSRIYIYRPYLWCKWFTPEETPHMILCGAHNSGKWTYG